MIREMQYVLKYLGYSSKLDQSFVGSVYLYLNTHNVSTVNNTHNISKLNKSSFVYPLIFLYFRPYGKYNELNAFLVLKILFRL